MDENLRKKLQDKAYRSEFAESFLDDTLPLQIRAIRESRGLSQKELGDLSGMRQGAISRLERADYGAWSVATLKRIARALDLPLSLKLESWSEFANEVSTVSVQRLVPVEASDDPLFGKESAAPVATGSTGQFVRYFTAYTTARPSLEPLIVQESSSHIYSTRQTAGGHGRGKGVNAYAYQR